MGQSLPQSLKSNSCACNPCRKFPHSCKNPQASQLYFAGLVLQHPLIILRNSSNFRARFAQRSHRKKRGCCLANGASLPHECNILNTLIPCELHPYFNFVTTCRIARTTMQCRWYRKTSNATGISRMIEDHLLKKFFCWLHPPASPRSSLRSTGMPLLVSRRKIGIFSHRCELTFLEIKVSLKIIPSLVTSTNSDYVPQNCPQHRSPTSSSHP